MFLARIPRRSLNIFLCASLLLTVWSLWCVYKNLHGSPKQYRVVASYWASGDAANHSEDPYAPQPLTVRYYGEHSRILPDLNLNPPFMLPMFQLLARVSLTHAFYIFTFGSLLLFIGTAAFILQGHPAMQEPCIVLLLLGAPILDTVMLTQIYALLLLLGAIAWWAIDNNRSTTTAIAIGLLVALKPMLILWPLALCVAGMWRLAAVSSGVAALASISALPVYGYRVFAQWFGALRGDEHYAYSFDISIPALFRRFGHARLGEVIAAVLLIAVFALLLRAKPGLHVASGSGICAALLCSPLAWLHYTLILFPTIATQPAHRLKNTAVILLSVPTYFPRLLAATPAEPQRIIGELILFTPCCVLLAWYITRCARTIVSGGSMIDG